MIGGEWEAGGGVGVGLVGIAVSDLSEVDSSSDGNEVRRRLYVASGWK